MPQRGKAKKNGEKITEDKLKAILDFEVRGALGRHDGELSEQRRKAMRAYYGESIGNEVAGRSRIVTRDVMEVVEWALPELMDVFTTEDIVARFSPNAEQDEAEAQQATDYVNHVFFNVNHGYEIFHDMFKDALMQKAGVVKIWWDDTVDLKREEYSGLDEMSLQKLASEDDVEIVAHSATPITDQETTVALGLPPDMPLMVHDVDVERVNARGKICIEVVPPEEFLVSKRAKTIDDAEYKGHRIHMTLSDLQQLYPEADMEEIKNMAGDDEQEWDEEYTARHDFDDVYGGDRNYDDNWLGRKVWITESYINVDWDNDGVAELRKITKAGNTILENIEVEDHPFALITPIKIPHKLIGMSLADITMDLQVTKSAILRGILDNIYNLNHGRFEALDGNVNYDDLLTSRPGGVIRVKQMGAIKRLDTPSLPNGGFDMLNVIDRMRDGRTGISKFRTGLDTDFLNNAKAGPVDNQMEAANARIRLYARNFKETGVKQIFTKIYNTMVRHQQHQDVIKLRGKWVPIDPSAWGGDCNVTVQTGLGHGDKGKRIQEMTMVGQQMSMLRQDPEMKDMVSRDNIYHTFSEGLKAMDYKNVGDFITNPKKLQPYKPQPDPKVQAEQAKAQMEMKKIELETQKMQQAAQMDQQKAQLAAQQAQQKSQLEVARLQMDAQKEEAKNQIELAKLQSQLSAEQQQNAIEHEKSQIEVMKVQADMARMAAEHALKEKEFVLKVAELELEQQQDRPVKIGE